MLFFTCTYTLVCEIVAAFVISPLILFTICFKMRTFAALALFQLLFFCFWFCCCRDAYESAVTYTFPFFPFLLYPIQMSLYYAVVLLRPCLACHFVSPHFALSQSLPLPTLALFPFRHVCWRVSNGIACLLITNIPWFRLWFDLFSQNIHSISFLTPWRETLINLELINFVTFVQLPLDYVRVKQSLLHLYAPSS